MDFEQKYNKYKQKYLELKKMKAGLRFVPAGPMIGYPTVPIMPPQVRVTGPIPQPLIMSPVMSPMRPMYPMRSISPVMSPIMSPVRSISPISPFLPMPFPLMRPVRLIRITSSEDKNKDTEKSVPTRYRINLKITDESKKDEINKYIKKFNTITSKKSSISSFTSLELYSTTDEDHYNVILKKLKAISPLTVDFDKVKVDGNMIKVYFKNDEITKIIPKDIEILIPLFDGKNSSDATSEYESNKDNLNNDLKGTYKIEIK
jgi:hypothetical protein